MIIIICIFEIIEGTKQFRDTIRCHSNHATEMMKSAYRFTVKIANSGL